MTIAEITVDQEAALSGNYAVPPCTVILRGDHLVRLPRRASACRTTVTMTVHGNRGDQPKDIWGVDGDIGVDGRHAP